MQILNVLDITSQCASANLNFIQHNNILGECHVSTICLIFSMEQKKIPVHSKQTIYGNLHVHYLKTAQLIIYRKTASLIQILKSFSAKSILQVPDTGTRVLDNTRPFLRSSIVSF